jgi:hypothetical protein
LQAKSCANERSAALWILPGRALENGVPCAARGASVTSHKKLTASFT